MLPRRYGAGRGRALGPSPQNAGRAVLLDRQRIAEALRLHHYQVMGDPYFVHGRYVVRAHDRFGHLVFVQVDPVSGAFVREVIL